MCAIIRFTADIADVSYSCHLSHLIPRETASQRVSAATVRLNLTPALRVRRPDYFGNVSEWFAIISPIERSN